MRTANISWFVGTAAKDISELSPVGATLISWFVRTFTLRCWLVRTHFPHLGNLVGIVSH